MRSFVAVGVLCCSFASAQTGIVTTIAGGAARGMEGDGGLAVSAAFAFANIQNDCDPNRFEQHSRMAFDSDGNLYITDSRNQRIRRIAADGVITTRAGSGDTPLTNARCEASGPVGDNGAADAARFYNPSDVLPLPDGVLVIADQWNNRIRQVSASGVVTTIAGSGQHNLYSAGIRATASPMDWPTALAVDSKGLIYFVELHGNRVGRIEADGRLTTIAGTGFPGSNGDGGAANRASLNRPTAITIDADGNLYIADTANHRVRKVAGGIITTLAGVGKASYCGDGGVATEACLHTPMDVKVDRLGNIYIADTGNHRVRRIDASGTITTIAGTGIPGVGADFIPPDASEFNFPSALAIDANNDLYVQDWQNYRIRKVDFHGALPVISSVLNQASLAGPVAPGSLISIFGENLARGSELESASVRVNGVPIVLTSVTGTRIDGLLPNDAALGSATILVTAGPYTNPETRFEVVAAAPGLFPEVLNEDGVSNVPSAPALPGQVVTLLLTGQGTGEPFLPAIALLGETPAGVRSIVLAPGMAGIARAEIVIPAEAPVGDAIPLVIEMDGRKSNAIPVAIGPAPAATPPEQ